MTWAISLAPVIKSPLVGTGLVVACLTFLCALQWSALGVETSGRRSRRGMVIAATVASAMLGAIVLARFAVIA